MIWRLWRLSDGKIFPQDVVQVRETKKKKILKGVSDLNALARERGVNVGKKNIVKIFNLKSSFRGNPT